MGHLNPAAWLRLTSKVGEVTGNLITGSARVSAVRGSSHQLERGKRARPGQSRRLLFGILPGPDKPTRDVLELAVFARRGLARLSDQATIDRVPGP